MGLTPAGLERLTLHESSLASLPVDQFLKGCAAGGITHVGLMRRNVQAFGTKKTRHVVDELGLHVTSYASAGGWAMGLDLDGNAMSLDENIRRLDEAAELGSPMLTGPGGHLVGSKDLASARRRVGEGLAELAPHAAARGVKFALEPMHPWYCPERSVVSSLHLALDLVESGTADALGIVLDAYHVGWDGELPEQVHRAGSRLLTVHINDLILPPPVKWDSKAPPEPRRGGLVGEGSIDFVSLRALLDQVGYAGQYEQEITPELGELPFEQLVSRVVGAYRSFISPPNA